MAEITRRTFTLLSAGGLLAGRSFLEGFAAAEEKQPPSAGGIFPYSTHIYREPHLPLEQLAHDLPVLKRLGFTMIKIQEVWGYDEPVEGQIDLSNVERVVSDARQNGLRVYFGVTMENPPMWLWRKYPDAVMVYWTGERRYDPTPYVLPSDGKPGPCWHHPQARAAGERFIESVGRTLGKYDNIYVWNVFQEINFGPLKPGPLGVCYCPHTLAAFRAWLRDRYPTLAALNQAWRSAYGDWEEIEPPRSSPKVPAAIDWRYFMDDVYLSYSLQWKAAAFRRSDPSRRPILGHVGGVTPGSTREWRYAEQLDILGASCYPDWRGPSGWDFEAGTPKVPLTGPVQSRQQIEGIVMYFDQLRSAKADGAIWTAELQGGPITEGLIRRAVPEPQDIRRWVLACLAAGSRAICFWNHRPEIFWEEGYGFSLLDWGSDTSARAEEAGRISAALNQHVELFTQGEHPRPQVRIVLNEDRFHWAECSLHDVREHLQYTVSGIWKQLWRRQIPVGFLESSAIPRNAEQVKVLICPFPLTMSEQEVGALTAYCRSGGVVVAEACPGRFDPHGIGFAGGMAPGVSELFGAESDGVFLIREPERGTKWTEYEYGLGDSREFAYLQGTGEAAHLSVFPAYYLQTLKPKGAQPTLTYRQEVAGTVNRLGAGKAWLAGTFLGHSGPAYNDWRNGDYLAHLIADAGVHGDGVGPLLRRRLTKGNQGAWFLFNVTESPVRQTVPLESYRSATDLLGAPLPVRGNAFEVEVAPMEIRCVLVES